MARTPYVKSVWVDKNIATSTAGTKLNAVNFNKLENGLEVADQANVDLEARVLAIESLPATDQSAAITQLVADLDASEAAVTALTAVVAQLRADFDAHTHSIETGNDTGTPIIPAP